MLTGRTMKNILVGMAVVVAVLTAAVSAIDRKPLGEIDFFGYRGFAVAGIRSALPFHEGDLFPPAKAKSSDSLKRQGSGTIEQVTGRLPTDVSFVCCDAKPPWMGYIGLPRRVFRG